MNTTANQTAGKGEYIPPSCAFQIIGTAAVICASGEIKEMDPIWLDDSLWENW